MQVRQDRFGILFHADRHHPLDQEQRALLLQGAVTIPEYREAPIVIPVMDNMLQDMGICTVGHAVKETSPDNLAPRGDSSRLQVR
jgi:hypothetical protein